MPLIKTSGIILNNYPLGEQDRMVEIFSEDFGRIQGVAKGARSFKNRFGGSLEPFTHCKFNLFKKRNGGFYRIESADIVGSFKNIREDLSLLLFTSSMVDTLRKLTPLEDPGRGIFTLLHKSLEKIAAGGQPDKVLSCYQTRLLYISGVGPRLDSCLKCKIDITKFHKVIISASEGGTVCLSCGAKIAGNYTIATGGTIAVMRCWQSSSISHINRFILGDNTTREMREILDMYIEYVTGKKVTSPFLPV